MYWAIIGFIVSLAKFDAERENVYIANWVHVAHLFKFGMIMLLYIELCSISFS